MDGNEVKRDMAFVVRSPGWQTFHPVISNPALEEEVDGFWVSYEVMVNEFSVSIGFHKEISSSATGDLKFNSRALICGDFETKRTGFVILHAVEGVSGRPCTTPQVVSTAPKLTPEPQQVTIAELPAGTACIGRLDENDFTTAVYDPVAFANDYGPLGNASAVSRIELEAS